MEMKFGLQLALAATSLTLGLVNIDVKSASAAIITYAFTVDSPTAKGSGLFSFDDLTVIDNVAPVQSLTFQFDGDANIYTQQNDVNYPNFPLVFKTTLSTGRTSFALDYLFDDQVNNNIRYEIVGEDFTLFSPTDPNAEPIFGTVSYTRVPEPTILGGVMLACGVTFLRKKKAIAQS